jgi:hypothetical protein
MKKRFLPISLLLVIMVLGQTMAIADQGGHYVPRSQSTMNANAFMGSLRANQHTGLIDPADMFKAMQTPSTRNAADDPLYWISMGPDNMGGLTTSIVYDNTLNESNNPNGVVYIGSMGGGVYKTYNYGVTWHQVGNLDLMVSCMVQDANGIIYVGTGDGNHAVDYNGLDAWGNPSYDNSFVGTGLYKIDARHNDQISQLVAATATDWAYINDLAIAGNMLLAATNEGLRYSTNNGADWTMALEGRADEVKVAGDNTIIASIEGKVYIGKDVNNLVCHSSDATTLQGDTLLPKAAGLFDITVAPSNDNLIYAASIGSDGVHASVFVSENQGETWAVALPSVQAAQGHNIYAGYGLFNHGLVVDPNNEDIVYVLGHQIWKLQKPASGGYYIAQQITYNTVIYDESYAHVGYHTLVFNPNNADECYAGTDGGIYKGTGRFVFANCNRNYVTTRMFSVAYSGKDTRVLAAGLDHGTVLIEGDASSNSMGYGTWINPSDAANMGMFDDTYHAGPCAISNINPNTFFVTYTGGGLQRTETAGEDWVSTNFTSSISYSSSSFRMPIVLHENFDDALNPVTVWFKNEDSLAIASGTVIQCMSENKFPFNYTLPHTLAAGDSIEVHDPISAKFFFAISDALYMTLTPLNFSVEAKWSKVADKVHAGFIGDPLSMGLSADGDNMFVGMKNGRFYRVSNLNTVIDETSGTITDSLFAVTTTEITLPISGQCVTSVSVDPRNANKVVVTCGNYGNDNYVFYSTNALSDAPEFNSVQGNLPKMPVYSSLIEMATGDVIIGTERGIYRTDNIAGAQWTADNHMMGEVPVMELKQQRLYHEDEQTVNITDEGAFVTEYPGVHNTGIIYAATYGKGVFRCENYKKEFESVPETPAAVETVTVNMYPNPVRGEATVSFNMVDNGTVSYQVFDLTGRMVMNQNVGRFAEGQQEIKVNTENLSTGSYILRLNQGANTSCVKFLVY